MYVLKGCRSMFVLILPILFLGAIAVGGLLTIGATRLGNQEVHQGRAPRQDEFVPRNRPAPTPAETIQFVQQNQIPLQQFITGQISNHRIVMIGEPHAPHPFSSQLGTCLANLNQEARQNLILGVEITSADGNDINNCLNRLGNNINTMTDNAILQELMLAPININMLNTLRLIIAARKAGIRVEYLGARLEGAGYQQREQAMFNNLESLVSSNPNSRVICYFGMNHPSLTPLILPNREELLTTMGMMASQQYGNQFNSIRVATDESGLALDAAEPTNLVSRILSKLNANGPIAIPAGQFRDSDAGRHNHIILAR